MSDGGSAPATQSAASTDALPFTGRKRLRALSVGALLVVAIATWMLWSYTHLVLDDARFMGAPAVLASSCDCSVVAVRVSEASQGPAGSIAVILDSEELRYALAEAAARVEVARAGADTAERRAGLRMAEAQLAQLRTQLARREVRLPFDATIDRVFVHRGDDVSKGRRLLMIHDPRAVYLEANVLETDLRYVHAGQQVAVTLDGFPDREFVGVVKAVGTSTTSQFGLLSTTAPAGSFVKVVQRIPLRIAVRVPAGLVRPGMQAAVRVPRPLL